MCSCLAPRNMLLSLDFLSLMLLLSMFPCTADLGCCFLRTELVGSWVEHCAVHCIFWLTLVNWSCRLSLECVSCVFQEMPTDEKGNVVALLNSPQSGSKFFPVTLTTDPLRELVVMLSGIGVFPQWTVLRAPLVCDVGRFRFRRSRWEALMHPNPGTSFRRSQHWHANVSKSIIITATDPGVAAVICKTEASRPHPARLQQQLHFVATTAGASGKSSCRVRLSIELHSPSPS